MKLDPVAVPRQAYLAQLLLALILPGMMLLLDSTRAFAVIETYEFEDDGQRQQYLELSETLRCPKCQNQNIADSNAPIAADMRKEVHRLIGEGKSNDDVVDFMVERFGEFVVYKPKLDASTYMLWFGPGVIAILGIIIVLTMSAQARKKKQQQDGPDPESTLSVAEQQKLNALLRDQDRD